MIAFELPLLKKIKYNNCDIPARLFFNELISGDISVLGKGSSEKLHKAYMNIIDEYCHLDNNTKFIEWFKKQQKISKIQQAITNVHGCLIVISKTTNEQILNDAIKLINDIEYPKVKFRKDKSILSEINRVNNSVIGVLKNELNMNLPVEKKQREKIRDDFAKRLVNVENILGRNIDGDVSLRKFIYLEKSAIEKIKPKN